MKKNILTNLHLKIASLVLALFLWVYVANVVDPWQSKTISNIPITFINTEVLTENSKTFSIAGSSNASVTVKVRSANYSKITASNFTAVIDCSKINDLNGAVKVEITYDNEFLLDEIRYNTDTVRLSTEDIKPYTYQLQATITGEDRIMEGYKLGDKTVDPGSVTITAPVSVLNDIYSAGVVLDVSGASGTVTDENAEILFYDRIGSVLNARMNQDTISYSTKTASVSVRVLKLDQVTVDFSQVSGINQVADGYRYVGLESTMDTVELMGTPEAVGQVERIVIPASELDVTGANATVEKEIRLSGYLPEGVVISGKDTVHVTLKIAKIESKSLMYTASRLQWIGRDDNRYEYELKDVSAVIPIVISGYVNSNLSALSAEDFDLTVDVSGLKAGEYELVPGTASLQKISPDYALVSPSTFRVAIRLKEGQTEEAESETKEAPGGGENG
ncbi:MAG: hypothetical protein IKQ96_07300 [Lachnospiraceae bacterium]|nr:hypothetical protein [Lachnospiraceae bacterium]